MPLTASQAARYARHIVLKDMGGVGQQKLSAAHVLVIGAGGLGAPVIAYLAGAGIGRLTIVDPDTVALSNLARQVIFTEADLGQPKAEAAARFVGALNSGLVVEAVSQPFSTLNGAELLRDVDLAIEGTDRFPTKRLIARICAQNQVPLVSGALGQFDGSVTVLAPFLLRESGKAWPDFEALYPLDPMPEDSPPCELAGVLNVLPGIIGTMMANEAIKMIAGFGEPLLGRLLVYSARTAQSRIMEYG
ncbi:MAG TPA: HesA/MoeB/ThiF family protein [Pelagibacterium sp.]|uniref:HesA/MoeB/ThiF family protein n=1 Tax=Pelagibacterium sp. TaxID=1967288 RepID=UPI002C4DE9F8|nr:HesA/MoeB/ThiF family protein [Pelagibacterium sp.]HWJ86466.1 HesA/MoeB/ThiF family protein [Pelagibacterium sp.]